MNDAIFIVLYLNRHNLINANSSSSWVRGEAELSHHRWLRGRAVMILDDRNAMRCGDDVSECDDFEFCLLGKRPVQTESLEVKIRIEPVLLLWFVCEDKNLSLCSTAHLVLISGSELSNPVYVATAQLQSFATNTLQKLTRASLHLLRPPRRRPRPRARVQVLACTTCLPAGAGLSTSGSRGFGGCRRPGGKKERTHPW